LKRTPATVSARLPVGRNGRRRRLQVTTWRSPVGPFTGVPVVGKAELDKGVEPSQLEGAELHQPLAPRGRVG